jgi:hypothetical protein
MIVAACPIRISRKSRSRSIASALLTIYHAAERAPAPDLIVLGACREPATAATETAPASEAMCTGFRETIAGAAREWGVWIALGYTRISDGATTPAATVFDPDGDAWIRHPRLRPRLHETDSAWSLRSTSMGAWALSADAVGPGGAVTAPPDAAGLALLPVYAEAGPDFAGSAANRGAAGVVGGLFRPRRTPQRRRQTARRTGGGDRRRRRRGARPAGRMRRRSGRGGFGNSTG